MIQHLDRQSLKFKFATLYGHLTTEWLDSKQKRRDRAIQDANIGSSGPNFGGEKLKARTDWEQAAFHQATVTPHNVIVLLDQIFDTSGDQGKVLKGGLDRLRKRMGEHEGDMLRASTFSNEAIARTLDSLLDSDILTESKRAAVKDFKRDHSIIKEVGDVLKMRLAAMDTWTWGDAVPMAQRRRLNGSYGMSLDEDVLQAIFVECIGRKWSISFKRVLGRFRQQNGIWKSPRNVIPAAELQRQVHYMDSERGRGTICARKNELYMQTYFLSQLLDSETQRVETKDGDEEAIARGRRGSVSSEDSDSEDEKKPTKFLRDFSSDTEFESDEDDEEFHVKENTGPKKPMEDKQKLLRLLSTDIHIKSRLHGEISCFHTKLKDIDLHLPHATIKAVLGFFGVSTRWINYFERFLQMPVQFSNEKPQVRKRGTPASHALSLVFIEVVLFCLDYQVNQIAGGENLWRTGSDIWFWSADPVRTAQVWTAVSSFVQTMGISLDSHQTGSARMILDAESNLRRAPSAPGLPDGDVRWGMLRLNTEGGRFEIDQQMVDEHIQELRRQLKEKESSVLEWIQAWNTFASVFFTSNFGSAANAFGQAHVLDMLTTHGRIQCEAAPGTQGVVGYLREMIKQRFGVTDVPDAYFFWPLTLGGLELQNPFVELMQISRPDLRSVQQRFQEFFDHEKVVYQDLKVEYEEALEFGQRPYGNDFFSFDEFTRYRETCSSGSHDLARIFTFMMKEPHVSAIAIGDVNPIKDAFGNIKAPFLREKTVSDSEDVDPYWRWLAQLYEPEVKKRFGGFNIVERDMLPVGAVNGLRSGKVTWKE